MSKGEFSSFYSTMTSFHIIVKYLLYYANFKCILFSSNNFIKYVAKLKTKLYNLTHLCSLRGGIVNSLVS